jgi:hypothetical protein
MILGEIALVGMTVVVGKVVEVGTVAVIVAMTAIAVIAAVVIVLARVVLVGITTVPEKMIECADAMPAADQGFVSVVTIVHILEEET